MEGWTSAKAVLGSVTAFGSHAPVNRCSAAEGATLMYPRTSAMLMAISDDWLSRAEHEDVRAELGKMKT